MATLRRGVPLSTRESSIEIDAGLPLGRHAFQLVVEDDARVASAPDQIIVDIQRVVLDPLEPLTPVRPDLDPRVRTLDDSITPVTPARPVVPPVTPDRTLTPVRPVRRRAKKRKPT